MMLLRTTVLLLALPLSGCTVLGLGIGSAVPAWEAQDHRSLDPSKLSNGERVRVVAKARHGDGKRHVNGTYRGVEDDDLVVLTSGGESVVAMDDVETLAVKRGNRAEEGAVIGFAVDTTILIAAVMSHGFAIGYR